MRIAIDARTVDEFQSGVGHYVLNLILHLRRIDRDNHYSYLVKHWERFLRLLEEPNPSLIKTIFSHENHIVGDFWEHYILPRRLRKNDIDLFHGPAFLIPFSQRGRMLKVVNVYDLVVFVYPETLPKKYSLYMKYLIRQAVRCADRVIAISESTRQDLMDILGVPAEKISIVPGAASPLFRSDISPERVAEVRRRYGITRRYVLDVGNIEPRKNLPTLFKAFRAAKAKIGDDIQLVITGKKGWLYGFLKPYTESDIKDHIVLTGYVAREDLPVLYHGAEAFAFPSLYEGFGLPILEAMACGTPVITSNVSSMPEVAGDAAILVDPTDVEQLAAAMTEIFQNPDKRADLSRRGIERARCFSWERTARETLAVYKQVYDGR